MDDRPPREDPGVIERDVYWEPWTDPGLEHLHLRLDRNGVRVDGVALRLTQGSPIRARYVIECDAAWRVREVTVRTLEAPERSLALRANGEGAWRDAAGAPLPALLGCLDVDISVTPFTNTLPIRRLGLAPGRSATLRMAYVRVPDLTVEAVEQRYTCIETGASGARYRYEGLGTGFSAELPVDADGLVGDYPGLSRRRWPRQAGAPGSRMPGQSGERFVFDYGEIAVRVRYLPGDRLEWEQVRGPDAGLKGEESYAAVMIRPDVWFIRWQEKDTSVVTQVVDFQERKVYTAWISPEKKVESFQGTIQPAGG